MSTTPNHTPQTPESAPSDVARALYSIDAVDEWRTSEDATLSQLRGTDGGTFSGQYIHDFNAGVDRRLDDFLAAKGIDADDPEYGELRELYREAGIDAAHGVHEYKWLYSPVSRGENSNDALSVRDHFRERIAQWHAAHEAADEDPATDDESTNPDNLTPEQWETMKVETEASMSGALEKYAKLVAERSKRLFEGTKTREQIDASREDVTDIINAIATQMMDELEAQGKTPEEIAQAIDVFVHEQSDNLMGAMEQHRIDEYEKSWKISKFVYDKWAKWTDESTDPETGKRKFFSKGSLKKMAATMAVTIPVGILAGVAIPALGLGAGAAAAAAMAGVGFRSVGRSLAGGFLDRKSQSKKLAAEQREEMQRQYEASMAHSEAAQRKTIFEVVDERSIIYRKRNRNRAIAGTAIAAVAGLGGATFGAFMTDKLSDDLLVQAIDKIGGNDGSGSHSADGALWTDAFANHADPVVEQVVTVEQPSLVEQLNLEAAFTVEGGHGYTHELIEAAKANGIDLSPQEAWTLHQELVDKVGGDYINLGDHSGADVYSMGSSEYQVGIAAPSSDATWDPKAQEILAEKFHELQGGDAATADPVVETTTLDATQMTDAQIIETSHLTGLEHAASPDVPAAPADWVEMKTGVDNLFADLQNGNYDAIRTDESIQNFLGGAAGYDVQSIMYPGTDTHVFEQVNSGFGATHWEMNPVPAGSRIPTEAVRVLEQYRASIYALAA